MSSCALYHFDDISAKTKLVFVDFFTYTFIGMMIFITASIAFVFIKDVFNKRKRFFNDDVK